MRHQRQELSAVGLDDTILILGAAPSAVKAVNPRAVVKTDDRTSGQIIQSIEDQGKIVSDALTRLRALLEHDSAKLGR